MCHSMVINCTGINESQLNIYYYDIIVLHIRMYSEYNIIKNLPKIPPFRDVKGWESIEICECGERLVLLSKVDQKYITIVPQYYIQHLGGALKECYARSTVAQMLIETASFLPPGYKLVVWDAWRPLEVQQSLLDIYKKRLKHQNPELSEEMLLKYVQTYVSLPSMNKNKPSPHLTGGAIDLSIVDASGHYLGMGTIHDDFTKKSHTRHYEQREERGEILTQEEISYRNNRRLLYFILSKAGFTNYPEEWWHYDYGNQFWGIIKGKKAIYGKIGLENNKHECSRI